jgi:hypothetical protein
MLPPCARQGRHAHREPEIDGGGRSRPEIDGGGRRSGARRAARPGVLAGGMHIKARPAYEGSRKFFLNFYVKNGGREAPGTPQGDPPCHHTTWWRGQGQATPWHGVGPPGPLHSLSQNIFTP